MVCLATSIRSRDSVHVDPPTSLFCHYFLTIVVGIPQTAALGMPKERTEIQRAAGKLIAAIQKEWGAELGGSSAEISEHVMGLAHNLLQAPDGPSIIKLLQGRSITDFLGELWVRRHPSVNPFVERLEKSLRGEQNA